MTTKANGTLITDNPAGNKGGWVLAAIITLIIALIPFCYGKYYEFNTNDPFDSALNIFHSHEILQGKKIGTDLSISAGFGTLLVNTVGVGLFGYSEFGPKLIQTIMQAMALAFAFAAIRKLYGNIAAVFAVILGSFYLSSQPYAKFGNVKDQYMIACMVIAASSFIFYELGKKKVWLLLAGAFAINTWYFKPTGFSLAFSLFVYLVLTTILKRRTIKECGGEIVRLCLGAGIGLLPLILFTAWLGIAGNFMRGFPCNIVALVLAVYAGLKLSVFAVRKCWPSVSAINMKLVLAGLGVIVLALIAVWYRYQQMGQGDKFLKDLPVYVFFSDTFQAVGILLANLNHIVYSLFFASEGYVAGSKSVSSFATQLAEVSKYSHSFVIIIGLSLAAIIWHIIAKIRPDINKDDNTKEQGQQINGLFILLAIWWICDMLFVWISPRAYVQYFLPPNGSGMFLVGYIISRIGKGNAPALLITSLVWLALELFTTTQAGLTANKVMIGCALMVLSGTIVVYFIKNNLLSRIVFIILLTSTFLLGNLDNYKALGSKLEQTKITLANNGALWEQLGYYLRDNSQKTDTLYVWGWMPGIYVAAERSCPAKMAAYSDMHSDSPTLIGKKITTLVEDMSKNMPLYIIDSQKMDFPFYDHPVFDLWPTAPLGWGNEPDRKLVTDQANLDYYLKNYDKMVEQACVAMTTRPNRSGGPLSAEKAQELAELEVKRHQAMAPLREFILKNYTPFKKFGNMIVLKRK